MSRIRHCLGDQHVAAVERRQPFKTLMAAPIKRLGIREICVRPQANL